MGWRTVGTATRSPFELVAQSLGRTAKYAQVAADRNEAHAPVEIAARIGLGGRQDAAGFAVRGGAIDQVLDHGLHVGVVGLADEAERSRQIAGPDKDAIHAINCGIKVVTSLGECSASSSSQSKPATPSTSVEIGLASEHQQPMRHFLAMRSRRN